MVHINTKFRLSSLSGLENGFSGGHFRLKMATFLMFYYIIVTYLWRCTFK